MKPSNDILSRIFARKRERVEQTKQASDCPALFAEARSIADSRTPSRFSEAFLNKEGFNIIAEIKRASPSKGIIRGEVDVASFVRRYESSGAVAVSVLTEEDHFRGSPDDLRTARRTSTLPILRKDFIFDEFQIFESVVLGADCILLIASMLPEELLGSLLELARDLKLDVLVEVHNEMEAETAIRLGADNIGVNNRDLKSFEVSFDISRALIDKLPADSIRISESGIRTEKDLLFLKGLGFDGFLIGEHLMREGRNPGFLSSVTNRRRDPARLGNKGSAER